MTYNSSLLLCSPDDLSWEFWFCIKKKKKRLTKSLPQASISEITLCVLRHNNEQRSRTSSKAWRSMFDWEYLPQTQIRKQDHESLMSPQNQKLISRDEKVVTSRVASCVLDEFIRSRGTLHPYFELRCYNMQKQKNKSFKAKCGQFQFNYIPPTETPIYLNLRSCQAQNCHSIADFNGRSALVRMERDSIIYQTLPM